MGDPVHVPTARITPPRIGVSLLARERLLAAHNTRIIVVGKDSAQARAVAQAIAREAFHNVTYFVGTYSTLRSVLK